MTDRELIVELCNGWDRRAQAYADEGDRVTACACRDKAAALRRMLAVCDAAVEWNTCDWPNYDIPMRVQSALAAAVDALDKEKP